jgi:hypothetical protein
VLVNSEAQLNLSEVLIEVWLRVYAHGGECTICQKKYLLASLLFVSVIASESCTSEFSCESFGLWNPA